MNKQKPEIVMKIKVTKQDNKKEKTTLTIKSSIKRKAEKAKLNLSQTLEEAILAKV